MWRKYSRKKETFTNTFVFVLLEKLEVKKIKSKNICFELSSSRGWGWHGVWNFHQGSTTIRAYITLPPTKAPATTLRTTGKIRASNGIRNTQSVPDSYSSSTVTFSSKRKTSVAKVLKSTASNVETKAFTQAEDNNTSTFYNTTRWPPTAVTVGNSCVILG